MIEKNMNTTTLKNQLMDTLEKFRAGEISKDDARAFADEAQGLVNEGQRLLDYLKQDEND